MWDFVQMDIICYIRMHIVIQNILRNENEVKYSIAPLISYTGNLRAAKIIKRSTTDNSRVEFEIQSTDGKILTLNKDESISFFIMCTVKITLK